DRVQARAVGVAVDEEERRSSRAELIRPEVVGLERHLDHAPDEVWKLVRRGTQLLVLDFHRRPLERFWSNHGKGIERFFNPSIAAYDGGDADHLADLVRMSDGRQ